MKFNIIAGWLGGQEILLILVIVLIFFGGKKIPELMRGLGKGVKEFKDATKDEAKDQPLKKDGSIE
jgi:sec-independent protein translocase protein TatA